LLVLADHEEASLPVAASQGHRWSSPYKSRIRLCPSAVGRVIVAAARRHHGAGRGGHVVGVDGDAVAAIDQGINPSLQLSTKQQRRSQSLSPGGH
jgi:hypothetical protein